MAFLAVYGIFSYIFSEEFEIQSFPKNLSIVLAKGAREEIKEEIAPLVEKRRKQGYNVEFYTASEFMEKKDKASGFVLFVGHPLLSVNHPYFLATNRAARKRVYLRRKVNTGFFVGEFNVPRRSDWYMSRSMLSKSIFAIGRFPVRSRADLAALVKKTLAYDDWVVKNRHIFAFSEQPGFSWLIDSVIHFFCRAIGYFTVIPGIELRTSYVPSKGPDLTGETLKHLGEGPVLSCYLGHGKPTALGRSIKLESLAANSLKELCGPLALMACQTGYQKVGDIAERLYLQPGGPSHVYFSSAPTHPYPDVFLGTTALRLLKQTSKKPCPIGTLLFSTYTASKNWQRKRWFCDNIAWLLVGLNDKDLYGLRDDIGQLQNLYGDPTQPIYTCPED